MSCNVKFNNKGEVEEVLTDAGTPSQLYAEAEAKFGEKEALDIFYVSQSDEFKETIPPKEKYNANKIAEKYTRLINKIKKEQPLDYWSVDVPSNQEILRAAEAGRIVDVKGGMGIVTEDGNMVGLFKYDPTAKGTAAAVQGARIQMGGIKLDNFDGYLTRTYQQNGFRVAARIPFNEEYAPEDWNKEKHGTPDVVFMIYDPNNKLDLKEKKFTDYDDAQRYRDSFVEEAKAGHPFYGVNPATSSNYANLTEDGKGNFVFYHVGGDNYKTIKPSSGGTLATGKDERSALSKVGGMAMYYTRAADSEGMVTGDSKYMVKIPMEEVYDFNTDPLNLYDVARKRHAKENPGKAFDANSQVAYITKIAGEKGYGMTVSEWNGRTRAQTTKEYTPVDYQDNTGNAIVKPFKENYVSNTAKGYIASVPKTKRDRLEGIYDKINKVRNAANRYDALYHLRENSSKMTEEEIHDLIMDSDLSESLKNEYLDTLQAPEQQRESFKVEEPSLESVMQYITAKNESTQEMNDEEIASFKNALISNPNFSYSKLREAFYDENGLFFVNPTKLVKSGLYSEYEAQHLFDDVDLQEQVMLAIEDLKNTEDVTSAEQDFDLVEQTDEFTSFGKLKNVNPYEVQKEIQNKLAATTKEEFDEAVGELPFTNFQKSIKTEEAKEALFNDMQAFKKAEMMIEVDGVIKPSTNSNNEVVVPQVVQSIKRKSVLRDIENFMKNDLRVLSNTPGATTILLKKIENGLIEEGYDVIGLSQKAPDVYMMQYFDAIINLSREESKEALDEYITIFDEYFEQDLNPEKGYIKSEQGDREFVKLDTQLKEEDVYNQQGLIKQEEGVYIKVNKKTSDELYPIVLTYPEKLPAGVKTEEQLRKYVQSTLNNDEVSDAETAEQITLFKMYYSIPLEQAVSKKDTVDFQHKHAQFEGNVEYLTKTFVEDFYRDKLKAKAAAGTKPASAKAFREFYRNFEVTEKGLELINTDPITLETIKPYVTENLKNYSLLSRSMPNLTYETVEPIDSKNSRRDLVSSYPDTVDKFEGNISILDKDNLIAKNTTDEFIKLRNEVYENAETIGNLTLYTKVDTTQSNYLNFNVEAPLSIFNLEDYLHLENKPESFIKSKNYLSKDEKQSLANDSFNCL